MLLNLLMTPVLAMMHLSYALRYWVCLPGNFLIKCNFLVAIAPASPPQTFLELDLDVPGLCVAMMKLFQIYIATY